MDHPLPTLAALTCTAPLLVGLLALYGIESQSLYSSREVVKIKVCPNCSVENPDSEHAPEVARHINSKQRHRNWEKPKQKWRQVKQTWSRSGGIVWTKKRLDRALLACAAAISWGDHYAAVAAASSWKVFWHRQFPGYALTPPAYGGNGVAGGGGSLLGTMKNI